MRRYNMNTATWKSFRYDEIFDIKKGKRLTKADMIEGYVNYIGATDSNNGITAKISNDTHIHSENTIIASYNGSIAEAFYQSKPFWATDDVNVLYPKFILTPEIALFLCTIINKEKYRFNYGRKWDKEIMQQSIIKLPVKTDNKPDWQRIEDYVKNTLVPKLPQKAKSVWNKTFDKKPILNKTLELNTDSWKWFKYNEIFDIKKGKRLTKADQIEGTINYIGATDSNNGITAKISNDEQLHKGNTITVSYNGSIAEAFYQTTQFWATDDVNVLYPKFELNPYIAMFLCTIIYKEKYRFNYGRKWDKKEMQKSKIKLPVTLDEKPDWQFMEDYIKSLPYSKSI